MGTVHLARLKAAAGSHTVVIKRLHPDLTRDAEFVRMFLHEARIAAQIRHPNVIPTLDVVSLDGEVFIALEHVHGESLYELFRASIRKRTPVDPRIITSIMSGVLHGLHAAHETPDERGQLLGFVHRDVSQHNILVGVDGVPRVLDFGVDQLIGRLHATGSSAFKNKLSYTAPEQLGGGTVTRQADVYSAAVVIWEALTGYRLFRGEDQGAIIAAVLQQPISPPSKLAPDTSPELDRIVMRGLERRPATRYATALEMALELEQHTLSASSAEVGAWVQLLVGDELARRAALIAQADSMPQITPRQRVSLSSPLEKSSDRAAGGSSPPLALQSEMGPRRAAPSLRRGGIALAALAVVAVACAVVLLLVARGRASSSTAALYKAFSTPATHLIAPPAEATTAALGQPDTDATDTAAPLPGEPETEPPEPTALEPEAAEPVTQEPATPEPATRSASRPAQTRTTAVRSTTKPKKVDCRVPYTIDGKGHKRYKAACL